MRAVEVTVHNFRSIGDAKFRLKDLSILAGENNAGKTNVVDAIRLFYGDYKYVETDRPDIPGLDDESWIEIEFEPTPEELEQLKDEYRSEDDTFRVRNYVHPSALDSAGKKRSGYYAYVEGELSETLFYGAKNVGSGKIGQIIYIPAVSRIDEHTRLTGPSSLRDLVANVLSRVVEGSPAYADLTKAFTKFTGEIKTLTSPEGQSLAALETEISNEIEDWETEFRLDIRAPNPTDLVKSLLKHELVDKTLGGEIDQARFGAGFQRSLVFTLIKVAAKFSSTTRPAPKKREFTPNLTWILFEEPEVFLHPSQEDILYDNLRTVSASDDSQVLLTTHSPRIVSSSIDDLTRLIRIRRDQGLTTARQLTDVELNQHFDSDHILDGEITPFSDDGDELDAQKMMSALKMEVWLQPSRAAAFFARSVLLVEGTSDLALCRYLASRGEMPSLTRGMIVVDCLGKYTIHRFISLFNAFGIDHAVLYDGDAGASHAAEVESAINEASGSFTHGVHRFEHDLETALGIPKPKYPHQKPQSLLYHLEAGLVDASRLQGVCAQIEQLCASMMSPAADDPNNSDA